jgi:hypothetical protein
MAGGDAGGLERDHEADDRGHEQHAFDPDVEHAAALRDQLTHGRDDERRRVDEHLLPQLAIGQELERHGTTSSSL